MRVLSALILVVLIFTSCRQSTEPEVQDNQLPPVPDSAEVTFNSEGWAEITSLPNNLMYENVRLVEAASINTAWVSDWDISTIYRTENGGKSWTALTPPIEGTMFYMEALDSLTIWIGTQKGEILKSTDGGYNWILQHDSYFINYIEFFDAQNGVAMGDGALQTHLPLEILHTTNGGSTWENFNTQLSGYTTNMAVSFADHNFGFMRITGSSTILQKTTDGGKNWTQVTPPFPAGNIYTVATLTNQNAMISFGNNVITTDGGTSWEMQNLAVQPTIYSKVRGESNNIYCIAGTLHGSSDSGKNWKSYNTGISTIWQSLSSPKKNLVWLSGKLGKVTYKILD